MAVKRKSGLGKGLDTMIPVGKIEPKEKVVEKVVEKVIEKKVETMVRVTDIEPNKGQPRKSFKEDALEELAESIKMHGVIQPLILQKKDGYFSIIAGERRWRAAKLAGIKEVPAIIKEYNDKEVMEIALIENIQREDLNPIEEAFAYKKLIDEYDMKQDEVAERVSKSRTAISNSIRLLKLSEEVQQMVFDEMISGGHARALITINNAEIQYDMAEYIANEKLSVRQTEKFVKIITELDSEEKQLKVMKALLDKGIKFEGINKFIKELLSNKTEKKFEDEFIYEDMKEKFTSIFGTQVDIKRKTKDKGRIEIAYSSSDELDRIMSLINKLSK